MFWIVHYVLFVLPPIPNPFVWLLDVIPYLCVLRVFHGYASADIIWKNKMSLQYVASVFGTGAVCRTEFLDCPSPLKETQIQKCPVVFLNLPTGYI